MVCRAAARRLPAASNSEHATDPRAVITAETAAIIGVKAVPLVCFLSWLLVHLGEGGRERLEGGQENRGINAREVFSLAFMPRKSLDPL